MLTFKVALSTLGATALFTALLLSPIQAQVIAQPAPYHALLCVTELSPTLMDASVPPEVTAEELVVLDEDSGCVLYEKNAHRPVAPASLTKIVTAIIALERGTLGEMVKVDVDSRKMSYSTIMGLLPGEELTLEDLLYGLILPSGNDAALAIARHIAGDEGRFVELMNQKVKELGLSNTSFVNPHGLDAAGQYSSAYDMAMLARYAMRDRLFARIVSTRSRSVKGQRVYELNNGNRLLGSYEGADGVKIGRTRRAGQTMVASARRHGHRVYVAFMHSRNRWQDSETILNYTFNHFLWPPGNTSPDLVQ